MEIIANAIQAVNANQNVYFTDTVVCGNSCISHRSNSGLVTIKGLTNQCRARYMITFGANVAIPADGTAGPITLAIAIDGEPVYASAMTATPTAVNSYFNIHSSIFVDVPKGCCETISVKNLTSTAVNVANANLIVTRVA